MNKFLESEEQRKIYNLILKYSGLHLTKIATLLNMKIQLVEQHLRQLEEKGVISSTDDTGYKRYYVEEKKVGAQDKRTIITQREIYELIEKNPGLHLSKIAEMMNMRLSLAQYHLLNLEKDDLIVSDVEEGYKRFYVEDSDVGTHEKRILSVLRREIPLQIVLFLLKKSNAKHKEILENINVSPSTLSYHLNKLVEYEIVDVNTYGDEKGYRIRNKKEIIKCLVKYIVIDGFKDLWDDFKVG